MPTTSDRLGGHSAKRSRQRASVLGQYGQSQTSSAPAMAHASLPGSAHSMPENFGHRQVRRYFSFDVFDTCLTRYCINPPDLFESLFTALLSQPAVQRSHPCQAASIETAAKALARSRIQAESDARSQVASDDVALAKIYQTFAPSLKAYGIDPADALAEEMEIELAAVSPILSIQKRIQQLRADGHIVIFISDMYLPGSVVRQMLIEHGFSDGSDGVYVSADIGFSKGSGRLFTYVCNQLGISPKQLHHTGDNAYADIRAAQQLGIRTTYFTQGDPTAYEQGFRSELIGNDWMRSYLIGLSRAVRLRHDSGIRDTHHHATLAADVVAPLLTSYVAWVLTTAQQTRIKELYFVEEGLYAIAQAILYQWQQTSTSGPAHSRSAHSRSDYSLPTCYLQSSSSAGHGHSQALVGFETNYETDTQLASNQLASTEGKAHQSPYGYSFGLLSTPEQPLPSGYLSHTGIRRRLSYLEAPITPYRRPEGTLYLFEYRQILKRFVQVIGTATLPIYRSVVLDYAVSLGKQSVNSDLHVMLKQYATRNAIAFLATPTPADVEAFVSLQLAADSQPVMLMAKPVTLPKLPAFSKQYIKGNANNSANSGSNPRRWIEGSVAISPSAIRLSLRYLHRTYQWLTRLLAPWRGKKIF